MGKINSYIGVSLKKLLKSDLTDKVKKWNDFVTKEKDPSMIQAAYYDEELYIYVIDQKLLYFISRIPDETGVECYSPYDYNSGIDDFTIPDTIENYYIKIDISLDSTASYEVENIGIEGTIEKYILDDIVNNFMKENLDTEKYLLLYHSGGSGPDYNNEYDSWYDFIKWIKLSDI